MVDTRPVRRDRQSRTLAHVNSLTASAKILTPETINSQSLTPRDWQEEAWKYYHSLGELRYAVSDWLGNALSRVRLIPAVIYPGQEPQVVEDGPIVQIVGELAGGVGGQAAAMKKFAIHLTIPGDSYLVGEEVNGERVWGVYSSNEIRVKSRGSTSRLGAGSVAYVTYEVMSGENSWRTMSEESLVVRLWYPDEQYSWRATSPCEAALPIMREIDMYNRYIIAILLSRLAMNGLLLIPSEVTFPVKEQFKNSADPFIAELIDIASRSIQNPGTASAAIPLPLKVPAELIEKFRHLTFESKIGDRVLEDRNRALTRLATSLNLPAEILTGVADINHWGQWQLEESAIKIHISPLAEMVCMLLTRGYLEAMMGAANLSMTTSDGGRYLIWYDTSALAQQPDRSGDAKEVYDRGELTGDELRVQTGFETDDAPSTEEFKQIALRRIALSGGADAMRALSIITDDKSLIPPTPEPPVAPQAPDATAPGDTSQPTNAPPETKPGSAPATPPR